MRTLFCPRSYRLFRIVFLLLGLAGAQAVYASPASSTTGLITPQQYEGVSISADGIVLLSTASFPPLAATIDSPTPFSRYGFVIAEPQLLEQATRRVILTYDTVAPTGTAIRIDVRGSIDGDRWSDWNTDVMSGTVVTLSVRATRVQYRATLLGAQASSPLLRSVAITPLASPPEYQAFSQQVAPTFKVHATRMGMVGGRTANGHIIKPHDHYVSLPSWRSLSSKNGHEYQVRMSYKGRSVVVPVWDVGPWNTHDDYWNVKRERFSDLPQGWPEDHAAFYDGYNKRRAEKGYVKFPTAIDVGDGVWFDDLQIPSGRAEVEITFLWMGDDPGPTGS